MLALILSTALFAKGNYSEYQQKTWEQKPLFARQKVTEHLEAGRYKQAKKWLGHAARSGERANQIQEIKALVGPLTEKRGQLEQVIQEGQEASAKAESARAELPAIISQIDELTAKENQLMHNILKQAEQADATAAQIAADVTGSPSMMESPTTIMTPEAPADMVTPAVNEPALTPTLETAVGMETPSVSTISETSTVPADMGAPSQSIEVAPNTAVVDEKMAAPTPTEAAIPEAAQVVDSAPIENTLPTTIVENTAPVAAPATL